MVCPPAVAASFDSVDLIPWKASSVGDMRRSPDGDNNNCGSASCGVVVSGLAQVLSSLLHPSEVVVASD